MSNVRRVNQSFNNSHLGPNMGSKIMRVAPNVTDPNMQNNRSSAEQLLSEMGEDPDSMNEVVFDKRSATKEELASQSGSDSNNTVLIIIFALIVVALIAVIVWMVMRQGSDKKEEEEIKRMIQQRNHPMNYQHPRSGMPPMSRPPGSMQPSREEPRIVVVEESTTKPESTTKSSTEFDKDHPHPAVLKPSSSAEVDEIMKKTTEMLKPEPVVVSTTDTNTLTDLDKALLDKVASESAENLALLEDSDEK